MLLNKRISIFTFLKQIKFDITAILIYAIVVGIADQYGFLSKIEIPINCYECHNRNCIIIITGF